MNEKIREGSIFYIEIDGERYWGYINTHIYFSGQTYGTLTVSHELIIVKENFKKILWFKLPVEEWRHKFFIGSDKGLFKKPSVPYVSIAGHTYYGISDVKIWCKKAIEDYAEKQKRIMQEEKDMKNTIHKRFIKD